MKAYLKDFNNTFAKIDSTYPHIDHDSQSSRTIRLLHRSLNRSKSCLEMENLCGSEVEIIFLFIALQFSIYIPRWLKKKRILRFVEKNRICVNKRRPSYLADFLLIRHICCNAKKGCKWSFLKKSPMGFLQKEEKSNFLLRKYQILSHPLRTECMIPNYNNL